MKLYFDKRKKFFSSGLLKKTVVIIITYENSNKNLYYGIWKLHVMLKPRKII